MKVAIIGYGKMGREIEKILLQRGHEVALIIDVNNASDLKIYVPTASVDAYKAAAYWRDYASSIVGYDF